MNYSKRNICTYKYKHTYNETVYTLMRCTPTFLFYFNIVHYLKVDQELVN